MTLSLSVKRFLSVGSFVISAVLLVVGMNVAEAASSSGRFDIIQVDLTADGIPVTQVDSVDTILDASASAVEIDSIRVETLEAIHVLVPKGGLARVENIGIPTTVTGVSAIENIFSVPANAPDFSSTIAAVHSSVDLRDSMQYADLSQAGSSWGSDYDLLFSSPLLSNEFLLIAETGGDSSISLTPLGSDGQPLTNAPLGISNAYTWSTGYAPAYAENDASHLRVLSAGSFVESGKSVYGIRVDNNDEADIKIIPMKAVSSDLIEQPPVQKEVAEKETPAAENSVPTPTSAPVSETAETFIGQITLSKTLYEGHNSGEGCQGEKEINLQNGADVTYCYEVENTGSEAVANIELTDEILEAVVSVTTSADKNILQPGEVVEYYIEQNAPAVSQLSVAKVAATVVREDGSMADDLHRPYHQDSASVKVSVVSDLEEDAEVVAGATSEETETDAGGDAQEQTDEETGEEPVVEEPEVLAFTGMREVVILSVIAVGLIFFGNTIRMAGRSYFDVRRRVTVTRLSDGQEALRRQ